jgi:hypothetical protein
MAQLGRFEYTVIDRSGNAISGASVEVRKQGAQVSGAQAGSPYTVNDIGGIIVGDTVKLNTGSTSRNVSAISATTVTTSGGDLGAVIDDDRITCVTLPTIYEDALGATSTPNPLTTDANGYCSCYAEGGKYDMLITAGANVRLVTDVTVVGEDNRSNIFNSGTAVAFKFDTLRNLGAADKILQVSRLESNEVFSVGGTGNVAIAGTLDVTGTTALTGAATLATLNVTGATTLDVTTVNGNLTTIGTIGDVGRTELVSGVASGSALLGAFSITSTNNLVGATDNLMVIYNAGVAKMQVTKDGDIGPRQLGPLLTAGVGAPGALVQPKGTIYMRTDGGVGTTIYVSQGGGTWNPIAGV